MCRARQWEDEVCTGVHGGRFRKIHGPFLACPCWLSMSIMHGDTWTHDGELRLQMGLGHDQVCKHNMSMWMMTPCISQGYMGA